MKLIFFSYSSIFFIPLDCFRGLLFLPFSIYLLLLPFFCLAYLYLRLANFMWFNKCGCVWMCAGVCGSVQVCTCVGTCTGVCGWTEYQIMIRVFMQRTLVYILYKFFYQIPKLNIFWKQSIHTLNIGCIDLSQKSIIHACWPVKYPCRVTYQTDIKGISLELLQIGISNNF